MIDFSTAAMRQSEGRDAWSAQLASLCGRDAGLRFANDAFEASIKIRDVGGVSIGHLAHNASEIGHDKQLIASDRCGHLMLIMQLGGKTLVEQGRTETEIGTYDLAVIDTYRPFVSRFDGPTRQLVAYLPSAELMTQCSSSMFARPRIWSAREGIGGLARSTFMTIARSVDRLHDRDALHAREMLIGVIKHMLERDCHPQGADKVQLPDSRIRAFIEAHLADPELGPTQIATGCGISVRRLHRSFAGTDWSVCGWIRDRRLTKCREDLLDPNKDGQSITQIAFRWGFNEAAHFSRSFRNMYQQSPRDLRRHLSA